MAQVQLSNHIVKNIPNILTLTIVKSHVGDTYIILSLQICHSLEIWKRNIFLVSWPIERHF